MIGKVNAIVSGQSGVAILIQDGELASLHEGRGTEIFRRHPSEARFLIGDAMDLQVLEEVELEEVARRLELATAQMDALHAVLILLDGSLTLDTRQEAAGELHEIMDDEAISVFVESILFAHPLPEDADLPGAFAACTPETEQMKSFLERLASLQEQISEVHLAWEGIPNPVFGTDEERRNARSVAVREGLFRDLVHLRAGQGSLDQFLVDAQGRLGVRLRQEVVHGWVQSLRSAQPSPIGRDSSLKPRASQAARPKPSAGGELHALLIGIDEYFPDRLPDGSRYPSLQGATRDVERMESFLRGQAGLTPERTRKLLSRVGKDGKPTGPPERMPTYANIVAAFKQLAVEAVPGDRVCIHYSGDGARLQTEYQEIKGAGGLDEALVPCDIGEPGSRYLRDLELAALVRLLVDRGLLVTLVLDSCHSGGVTRTEIGGGVAVVRKVPEVRLPPVPSAVAKRDLLMRAWQRLWQEDVPMGHLSSRGWLPVARYVLFAACRPSERAFEYPFEKGEPQGALTYALLETLRKDGLEQSCDLIQKKLVATVHGTLKNQTPMLVGDGDRLFLGGAPARQVRLSAHGEHLYARRAPARQMRLSAPEGPMVLRVAEDGRVLLNWGQASGARDGSRLVLRAPSGRQRALLEVREVGATESLAEVVHGPKPSAIPPGSYVEVFPLQAVVRLLPPEPGDSAAEQALEQLRKALWSYRGGFVEIDVEAGAADFCVAFTRGSYEIWASDGSTFPNLAPVQTGRGAVPEVVRRLDHLARYRSLRSVDNPDHPDWLEIGLEFGLGDEAPSAAPVPLPPGGLDLRCDEEAILRIVNRSSLRLYFVVFDLAPDYSVTQLLPPRKSFSLLPLDPGEGHIVRLRGWLPPELKEGVDILKVFATRETVSFRWLELPPLDRPAPERLMRRGGTPLNVPEDEWITVQVEIRTRR